MSTETKDRQDRVPAALQQVFLMSNRGREVDKPPPNSAASKVYVDSWIHQRQGTPLTKKNESAPITRSCRKEVEIGSARRGRDRTRVAVKRQRSLTGLSPQQYLDLLLKKRGYTLETYSTVHTGYYNAATKLQMASYGIYMADLVRKGDVDTLRGLMTARLLSPNPCNLFGESLVHKICRLGNAEALSLFIEVGASVQVSDDHGRTPLHDACWGTEPAFEVVELLLQQDPRLFYLKDKRGSLPLSYAGRDYWYAWREFFDRIVDIYYPAEKAIEWQRSRNLCNMAPNSCPLPEHPVSQQILELVSMVSSGRMSIQQVQYIVQSGALLCIKNNPNSALDESEYEDSDEDEECCDTDSPDESDFTASDEDLDECEMEDHVMTMLSTVRAWDKQW